MRVDFVFDLSDPDDLRAFDRYKHCEDIYFSMIEFEKF